MKRLGQKGWREHVHKGLKGTEEHQNCQGLQMKWKGGHRQWELGAIIGKEEFVATKWAEFSARGSGVFMERENCPVVVFGNPAKYTVGFHLFTS